MVGIGYISRNRAEIQKVLEAFLGVKFEPRESSYIGLYELYRFVQEGKEAKYMLRDNFDPQFGGEEYPELARFPVILLAEGTVSESELNAIASASGGTLLQAADLR
ncbi:hypothetical protein E7T09_02490 [Deinococcus sp. KSM4-11]|uniref:hypothetical protein n=1 Tax=Deinococcus sp. KSM4-11 TaxID=2568654 RepID=UPI0010A317AB|nr:hypothetical protein [Deinococcus sp. KSM4-11]THF88103.1 hypothetical protein E7T09_02490 [Deinococcus sp. KSM4-11]